MPAAQIKAQVGDEVWEHYFKFCVIRNPYEKAVSAFFFFAQVWGKPVRTQDAALTRQQFEAWLLEGSQLPLDRDKYVIDGRFCMNDVVRFEALEPDLARVCARVGVPWNPDLLPNFKRGIRPAGATVDGLYSEASKRVIESVYAYEIERFGYSFPADGIL